MCASATVLLMALFAAYVLWLFDQLRRRRELTEFADELNRFFEEHDPM